MAKGGSFIEFTKEEIADKKKAIFESMGKRAQDRVLKKGYDVWDPFEEPKDPIDIRTDVSDRTSQQLIREFLQGLSKEEYSTSFASGAWDICLGIVNSNEKFLGMYEFSIWYRDLLAREGHKDKKKG